MGNTEFITVKLCKKDVAVVLSALRVADSKYTMESLGDRTYSAKQHLRERADRYSSLASFFRRNILKKGWNVSEIERLL